MSKLETGGDLRWLKGLILPAAKMHTSRKITAGAVIAAAISGFRFVDPTDGIAQLFRGVCLITGTFGFLWLIILLIFPPPEPLRGRTRGQETEKPG
jgi:hypothetical protein